jgi:GAF domain-containing protein
MHSSRDYSEPVTAADREARLTEAFVSLADSLVSDYDVVDLLHTLIDVSIDLLGVTQAGLVLHDPTGALEVLASSSEETRLLELLQLEDGQGPCVECYATSQVVSVDDLTEDPDRWPRFQAGAAEYGFVSVHAVPMRLRRETLGALNLFSSRRGPMDKKDAKSPRHWPTWRRSRSSRNARPAVAPNSASSCRTPWTAASSSSRRRGCWPSRRVSGWTPPSGCCGGMPGPITCDCARSPPPLSTVVWT